MFSRKADSAAADLNTPSRPSPPAGKESAARVEEQKASAAPLDRNTALLLEVPGLHNFWDGKKWVVSHERFQGVADAANVTLPTPPPMGTANVFHVARSYESDRLQKYAGVKSSVVEDGETYSTGRLLEILGDKLLTQIGCDVDELYSSEQEYGNKLPSDGGDFEVRVVRIETPPELEISRDALGENLVQQTRSSTRDEEVTITDKVGQRTIASALLWTGLEQPNFLDARAIHPPVRAVEFSKIDLAGFPLEEIKGADPREKKIWVFEDTQQGFAVVHDGERRFVVSNNRGVMQLAQRLKLTLQADNAEASKEFDTRLQLLVSCLNNTETFSVVLARSDVSWEDANEQLATDAHQLLSHPDPIFIKSSRSSGGELVLRSRRDCNGEPIIESDSGEVGDILAQYVRRVNKVINGHTATGTEEKILAELAMRSIQQSGSVRGFLVKALQCMETPIVEEEIPVTRYKTDFGEEKAEFRMIMQGHDELKLVAHYAKASLSDIAANISLGGRGRATQQVVRGIFQQQLAGLMPQEEINRRAGESLSKLTTMAETFAREFAKKVVKSGVTRSLNDFAVDICPVWDAEAQDLRYVLLEVQYGYAFEGLRHISPEKAQEVQEFKDERRKKQEQLWEQRKQQQQDEQKQKLKQALLKSLKGIMNDRT